MMKTSVKTLLYACLLSMTMSCSGSSSSSSDGATEVVDSIPVHTIDQDMNMLEVFDMGTFPAGQEVRYAVPIMNFDDERGVRITGVDGDDHVRKCNPSLDSIEPEMLISVDFKLKVPEKKGPFDATMRIHYKNVKNPSIIKLYGNAE